MTYESFLDFMVAMTWKKAEASINFYWRILDVDKRGYLTIANVILFFKVRIQHDLRHHTHRHLMDGVMHCDDDPWSS